MKYEIKREENAIAEVQVTIEQEKVKNTFNQAYNNVSKDVTIPGFRKGKAPRAVLAKHIRKEAIDGEAAELLVSEALAEIVTAEDLFLVDRPRTDVDKIDENEDFTFTAKLTLRPVPEIGEYKGLPLTPLNVIVTEDNIDSELKQMQERRAQIKAVDDVIKDEDTAQIAFTGYIDGEAFEGGSNDNYSLVVGSGTFIPGFEEQLIGHKAGEKFDVTVTFPEEYHSDELQGKEAKFEVEVKEVRRKEYLPLDDQFAKDVSEFETMQELRDATRKRLEFEEDRNRIENMREQAVEQLLTVTEVEIPAVMVEDKIDSFMEEMNGRLSQQGLDLEKYLEYMQKDMKSFREENRERAEKSVKTELALIEVAEKENIEATEDDINAEIAQYAMMTNTEPEVIREKMMETGQLELIGYNLRIGKAIDFLVDHGKIVSTEEMMDAIAEEPDEDKAESEASAGAE